MTTALVLGATGCIGNNIVRACLQEGWTVRAFHRATSPLWTLDGLDVERLAGDLADEDSLAAAMLGADVVFHAAAYYPLHSLDMARSLRRAVGGMRTVLSVARASQPSKLVYTSSLTTIGKPASPGRLADERDYYLPGSTDSAYFECKWAMEAEAWRASSQGLPVVIVNPTAVFGPWDSKPATGEILVNVARGRLPVWLGGQVNVVDARDVGRGQVLAAMHGRPGQRYILGGENLSVREALTIAAEQAGASPPRWRVPPGMIHSAVWLGEVVGRLPLIRPLPLEHFKTIAEWQALSSEKARSELGYSTRPFFETIRETIDWFRRHGYLPESRATGTQ